MEKQLVVFPRLQSNTCLKSPFGLLRRSEFRDGEGQGINWSFWPFQAKKKIKEEKKSINDW